MKTHFRYCRLKQNWVALSPERARRPSQICLDETIFYSEVFRRGNEQMTPGEIFAWREQGEWEVRVVPNLYRIVSIEEERTSGREGFFEWTGGYGAHEVVVETPTGEAADALHWPKILETIRLRYSDLSRDPNLRYIQVFKNNGPLAGASMSHPHAQIVGLPILPPLIRRELEGAYDYFRREERPLVVDEAREEEREETRVVLHSEHFIAYTPYASFFPFQLRIAPLEARADWLHLGSGASREIGDLIARLLGRLEQIHQGGVAYNILYYLTPPEGEYSPFDLPYGDFAPTYIDIVPRLSQVAGFELSTGLWVNFVPPEEAAEWLRSHSII